jgi:hypothetical protein
MRQAKPAMLTEVDMRASMSKSWAATARRLSASLFPQIKPSRASASSINRLVDWE